MNRFAFASGNDDDAVMDRASLAAREQETPFAPAMLAGRETANNQKLTVLKTDPFIAWSCPSSPDDLR